MLQFEDNDRRVSRIPMPRRDMPLPADMAPRKPERLTPRTAEAVRAAEARIDTHLRLRWFIRG